jgi:hypothetical protein
MTMTLQLRKLCVVAGFAGVLAMLPAPAAAGDSAAQLRALDRMMIALGPQSARDAAAIKELYRPHLDLLLLDKYADLEGALATGGLVPLPPNPAAFNLAPRLDGLHPIGEKDLDNQDSYIAARPATMGALITIASRVRSGPVEITSLVRHTGYQAELRATNHNATTSVPMHTMGLAFDIALVNTPLSRVHEIRDVLVAMRAAGDILFIGERKQLVFHVVPQPSRLGYFNDVYARAVGSVSGTQVVEVVAPGPPRLLSQHVTPSVVTDVVAVMPSSDHLTEWNAALERDAAAPNAPIAAIQATSTGAVSLAPMVLMRGVLAFVAALFTGAWRIAARA